MTARIGFLLSVLLSTTLSAQFDYTDIPFLAQSKLPPAVFNVLSLSNMIFWYKADDYAAQANGTGLTTILDKSTNGNHATNPVVKTSPILTNNVLNGKSAFRFVNGSNTFIQISNTAPFGTAVSGEIVAVLKTSYPAGATTNSVWQMENITFPNSTVRTVHGDANTNILDGFGSDTPAVGTLTMGQLPTSWHIYSLSVQASNMQMRWNGELIGGNDYCKSGFTNRVWIGQNEVSGSLANFDGWIADIMAFSNVLSKADRSNLLVYLGGQYSISVTNPADIYTPTNFAALTGWWDADTFAGWQPDGAKATNWTNRAASVMTMTWTNSTDAQRADWRSNAVNGHACLTFDKSANQRYYINPIANYITNASGAAMTLISVRACTNGNASGSRHFSSTDSTDEYQSEPIAGRQDKLALSTALNSANYPRGITNLCMDAFVLDPTGGSAHFYDNMTNGSAGGTNLLPFQWNTIGKSFSTFGGDLCEVVYYRTNLDFPSLVKLYYSYFRPKWGLP